MASPYQILYTNRQYDDVQKTINYYLNKANGNYNLAASQYPYGPNAFNELVKYRDTLQAQLSDLNNNQASMNLFGNVNRYNYTPASTTYVATINKQPVMTPTQDEIINNVMNRVGNNIPSNIQLKEGILTSPTIDTKTPIETIKAATETPTTPQLLPPTTPAEQLPDVLSPTFMQLYRRFGNLETPTVLAGTRTVGFQIPNNLVTKGAKTAGKGALLGTALKMLPLIVPAIVSGTISIGVNKPSGKNAPDYSNVNPELSKQIFSFNSPNASAANDLYRTLYPSDVYSHMKTFDQFAKSSGDFGPVINPEPTKSQTIWKYIGQYGVPALTTLSGIFHPLNFLSGAFAGGTAYVVGNAAAHNPRDFPVERLFNPETLKPYADKGVAVMTTDYNGRPYLFLPELVYKDGKITPTGRFSRYISLYDKNSIQKIVGNNIQVARDDTKGKYIYYFTPTGNMSKGALPIAFVNTTPQIVNDIFNDIEGSSNNQLTTKVMDIMDYYRLGDVNEYIPEFHNLFEVNTPTITVPTKADSTSSNTGSGNTGSKGTSGKGTGSGSSNNKQNKEEFTTGQENWDNWFKQFTGQ